MSFRGITALLPIGQLGFTGTKNPSQAEPGHFTYTDGAELEGGIIRKEGGADKLNATALDDGVDPVVIVSGIGWSPDGSTSQLVVFTSNGDILGDDGTGAFATTIETGLTDAREPPPSWAIGGGETVGEPPKLFMFSATNQVEVIHGDTPTTGAAITTPPADWAAGEFPIFGVAHANRIFAGGNLSDPHRLYYTGVADHEVYSSGGGGGTISIYPGDGQRLIGGISFRGALILWKYPTGIYIVNTSDPTPANWTVARMTRAVGSISQHTIVQIENDVLYLDRIGNIHALGATNEFGDVNTSNIGERNALGPWLRENINQAALKKSAGIWYPSKRQAWFAMPQLGSTENNIRIMLGFEPQTQEGAPVFRPFLSRRDEPVCMFTFPDDDGIERPHIGDPDGFVWKLDTPTYNKDGLGYLIDFETGGIDFSYLDPILHYKWKNGAFLEINYEPQGAWNLDVEIYWDDRLRQVIVFPMGFVGGTLDSFTLDTDVLGADSVKTARRRVVAGGRRFKLKASNSGVGENVVLAEFHLAFTVGDERVASE